MCQTLSEIARQLRDANKKVHLIYGFNGTGKTRLSREFKQLIAPKNGHEDNGDDVEQVSLQLSKKYIRKTSTFLGYKRWGDLLPKFDDGRPNPYEVKIINISSHSKHAGEEVAELTEDDKRVLRYLVREINTMYRFHQVESYRA